MRSRDGPAAVRGDALRRTPLAPAGKAAEGEPRVRRPAARRVDHRTPRGREDSCPGSSSSSSRRSSSRSSARPAAGRLSPHRIVSLSPTATESLFAIGAGPQVIAVDDQSDYPKNRAKTTLSGFTPNVEAIAGYKPDLVVVAYDPNSLVATLRRLGIRVLVQDAAKNLADAYAQIAQLGKSPATLKQATGVVATMKKRIAALVAAGTPRARGLTVFHELGPDLYSVTSSTFIGRVYALFGLKNIADAADTAQRRLPEALGRVRRLAEPGHRRPRRHRLLRADGRRRSRPGPGGAP